MSFLGLHLAACAILVVAGLAKAIRPSDTATVLATRVPMPVVRLRAAVRGLALVEALLGIAAMALPNRTLAGLVAISYAGFATIVARLRAVDGVVASCGCFGTPDTPATVLHIVLNSVFAVAAAAVALEADGDHIGRILSSQPAEGLPLVFAGGVSAWLAFLGLARLSRLQAVRAMFVDHGGSAA